MKKVFSFVVLLFFGNFLISQINKQNQKVLIRGEMGAKIDSLLTPYVGKIRKYTDNNAGLAVGVTKGEKVIYARTFGYSNIEKSIETDFNSLFHIASLSKPFAAIAIVKLAEQGLINLDEPFVTYVPEFQMKGEDYKSLTIKHILTHTSGIPRHVTSDDLEKLVYGQESLDKLMKSINTFDLDFEPGAKFSYSNSGFDLLAILVQKVSKMTFEEYVKNNIFEPMNMTQSVYKKPRNEMPDKWAVPYSYGIETQEWKPYPYSENYFPSSGLQISLLDICKWGILHVNKGVYEGREIISPLYFKLLTHPYYQTPWKDSIGLSWFLQSYLDRPIIMHSGTDTGFESIMYIYPEDSISIIVMANRDFARTGRIINAVSEIIYDYVPKDYNISAKYLFAEVYKESGIEEAKKLWESLKLDTTDIYYVDDEDILTTGAVLENGGHWNESKDILEYYNTLDSQSTYSWRLLGNANLALRDTITAKSCYEQTLIINPNYEKGRKALEKLNAIRIKDE